MSEHESPALGVWKPEGSVSYGRFDAQFKKLLEDALVRAKRLGTAEIVHAHGQGAQCNGECLTVLPSGEMTPYPEGPPGKATPRDRAS